MEAGADEAPELSVVIPVHNEAANIRSLLDEVCVALRGRMRFEIVVVDDVSTDETQAILKNARRDMRELRALRHRQNAGQSMSEIGRAHVCTPVTNAHLVCRLLHEKKQQ